MRILAEAMNWLVEVIEGAGRMFVWAWEHPLITGGAIVAALGVWSVVLVFALRGAR